MKSPALARVLEDVAVAVPPCGHMRTLETVRRLDIEDLLGFTPE
jgi:hypothetical protein